MTVLKKHQTLVTLIVLAIAGFAVFSPVIHFQFLSDDWDLISHADQYHSCADRFVQNDHQTTAGYSFRPIVGVYLTILKSLFGLNPAGYHVFFVLIHLLNVLLVFLFAKMMVKDGKGWYWISVLASFLFVVLPAHGEAVFWVSAGADIVATAFYLSSILFFLNYLECQKRSGLLCSLVCCVLGVLTKEIAITLPIALAMLLFFYHEKGKEQHEKRNRTFAKIVKTILPYLAIVGVYLLFRWNATGVLFGYYGRESVGLDIGNWISMASDTLLSYFVWGNARLKLAEAFKTQFHWLVVLCAFVVLYSKRFHKESLRLCFVLFMLFVISVLPVLPLGFNPLSDEGERYGYLPSVFFVLIFAFVLYLISYRDDARKKFSIFNFQFSKVVYVVISLMIFVYFGYGLRHKMIVWQTYQNTNDQILNQLYQLNDSPRFDRVEAGGRKMVIVGLPDSYHGVQGFRNGIEEAYEMYYGEKIEVVRIPVYTVDEGMLGYRVEGLGYSFGTKDYFLADGYDITNQKQLFLKTKDKSLRLTGEKEYEDEYVDIEFFRWHYGVNRADGVTMKLKDRLLDDVQNGNASLIVYDGTRLVRVL